MFKSDYAITTKHTLVHLVCAFLFGVLFSIVLPENDLKIVAVIFAVVFVLLSVFNIISKFILSGRYYKKKLVVLPCFLVLFVLLGIFRTSYFENSQNIVLRSYEDKEAWLSGRVVSESVLTSSGYYYTFEVEVTSVNDNQDATGKIVMYSPAVYGNQVNFGNEIYAWTKFSAPKDIENKSIFNYTNHLKSKNIFLIGRADNIHPTNIDGSRHPISMLKNVGIKIRKSLTKNINHIFPKDKEINAILKGILLGDKTDFTDEMYEKFSKSGISHVVAVSGLHLSMLAGLLLFVFRHLGFRQSTALILTFPVILLFTSVTSFTPSVCRAAIMLSVAILALLFNNDYDSMTALFLALGIIVAVSPFSILSVSLILSFSATFGILAFGKHFICIFSYVIPKFKEPIGFFEKLTNKSINAVLSALSLSISAFIPTLGFIVFFFKSVSLIQFFTNLWVIFAVTFVFCLGYIACILYFFSPILTFFLLRPPLEFFLNIIRNTVTTFGQNKYTLQVPDEKLNILLLVTYILSALAIYLTTKALYDHITEKELSDES